MRPFRAFLLFAFASVLLLALHPVSSGPNKQMAHAMPIAGGFGAPKPAAAGDRYTEILRGVKADAQTQSGRSYETWEPLSYTTQ